VRRSAILALLLLLGCGAPPRATVVHASPEPAHPRRLVVISIDGLRHDYLDDERHDIPTLRRLRNEGARARRVQSVAPSVTYPAHATLVTGASPARHGIVANTAFDPFGTNEGGWYWYASDLRVPTLWDVAAAARIDCVNVTWPVTAGAQIRWNLPQYWRAKNEEDEKLLALLSTPGLYREVAKNAPPPGEHRSDLARAQAALYLLRTRQPGLALVYFADLDTTEHEYGPMSEPAWATLEATDHFVSEIIDAAPDAAIAIVSDHGFTPIRYDVRPNVALRAEGLLVAETKIQDGRTEDVLKSYDAVTWRAGGMAGIYARAGADPTIAPRVRSLFARLASDPASHIARMRDGQAAAGGFPGAIVVLEAASDASFTDRFDGPVVAPSRSRGAHGHAPELPEMGTSFVFWGPGIPRADLGDVSMLDIGPTLAAYLGLTLPAAEGHALSLTPLTPR
jgi:predicted AlkP superfamily pyrophosphatase or phosphodiesterase